MSQTKAKSVTGTTCQSITNGHACGLLVATSTSYDSTWACSAWDGTWCDPMSAVLNDNDNDSSIAWTDRPSFTRRLVSEMQMPETQRKTKKKKKRRTTKARDNTQQPRRQPKHPAPNQGKKDCDCDSQQVPTNQIDHRITLSVPTTRATLAGYRGQQQRPANAPNWTLADRDRFLFNQMRNAFCIAEELNLALVPTELSFWAPTNQ